MPSNTDDGIVEKVAEVIRLSRQRQYSVTGTCDMTAVSHAVDKHLAREIIDAHLTHLRDKGMVVVPIGVHVTQLSAAETDADVVSASPVQSER